MFIAEELLIGPHFLWGQFDLVIMRIEGCHHKWRPRSQNRFNTSKKQKQILRPDCNHHKNLRNLNLCGSE